MTNEEIWAAQREEKAFVQTVAGRLLRQLERDNSALAEAESVNGSLFKLRRLQNQRDETQRQFIAEIKRLQALDVGAGNKNPQ